MFFYHKLSTRFSVPAVLLEKKCWSKYGPDDHKHTLNVKRCHKIAFLCYLVPSWQIPHWAFESWHARVRTHLNQVIREDFPHLPHAYLKHVDLLDNLALTNKNGCSDFQPILTWYIRQRIVMLSIRGICLCSEIAICWSFLHQSNERHTHFSLSEAKRRIFHCHGVITREAEFLITFKRYLFSAARAARQESQGLSR